MYKITTRDGAVLYDVDNPDLYMVTEPKATLEIGQPGSLQFSLVPEHPMYNSVAVMETYVCALRENTEFFYGRIIDINVDETTGIKQIECAGALQFLEDGELHPIVAEQDENENNGEEQQEQGVEMTASQFFARCISDYNSDIQNDVRRVFSVGTISHSKSSDVKLYNIQNFTQAKTALETNLIGEYGGYFRVRKSGNTRYIDWLDGYNEVNTSPIRITENILNQENAFSANDFYTLIRPIGKNNLMLPEITVPINQTLLNRYGRIIQTVNFGDADTVEELRVEVNKHISKIGKGIGKTATIKVIDMHFLSNAVPYIRLGATYTNITGFINEDMIVAGMELYFATPSNDTVTLKNWKELLVNQTGGTSGRGTITKATSEASTGQRGFQNIWKHISETEDSLTLHAKLISINAEHLVETATEFERYSRQTQDEFGRITGTGVFQNNDLITQVAGSFSIKYYKVPNSKLTPETNPSARHWYVCSPHKVTEADINSGKEFYASPGHAMAGKALGTAGLAVGDDVWEMHFTSDTSPQSGVDYYTKGVALSQGTDLTIDDEGMTVTVAKDIVTSQDGVDSITGSALWTQKDHITGVCGDFEIKTDSEGRQYLSIVSGGGIRINKDGTDFGLYDQDNLTAGIIVGKINDPNNDDKVLGTKVDIVASQVRVGSTSNVAAWMEETGGDINDLQGLIADHATILDLQASNINSLTAAIGEIEADYITSAELQSMDLYTENLYTGAIHCDEVHTLDINGHDPDDFLANAVVDGTTLRIYNAAGTEVATFSKAVSLSGSWNGATYTVTASPAGVASPVSTTISLDLIGSGNIIGAQVKEGNKIITSSGAKLEEDVSNKVVTCTLTGGSLGQIAQVSTTNTFIAGYNSGAPSSGTVGERASGVTDFVYGFSITRADGSTYSSPIYINCNAIRDAARQGYTYGTFTQATVKVSGTSKKIAEVKSTEVIRINSSAVDLYTKGDEKYARGTGFNAYPAVSDGGTVYYKGDGGYFTAQGATGIKVSEFGSLELFKKVGSSYKSVGNYTWYRNSGGTQYYKAGTEGYYARGTNTIRVGTLKTVYPGDGGKFNAIGTKTPAYKKLSSGGTLYYTAKDSADWWQAPTTNTTDYYTKS